ncbi:MAG TPA: matrixin family metalloprotease [Candidatus Polarisedimenticolaceae bacterium]|nr:matrixin family metalloprotease [Candidatus Polarisedimenticolaceae bacterium]
MRRIVTIASIAAVLALAAPHVAAYCLTGLRWPDNNNPAPVRYNSSGKITSGQCITSAQLDSAITGGIGAWTAITYAGTTSAKANRRDGTNTVGWARLGGGTLGVTNYLDNDGFLTVPCGGNFFANLYEADVRITTVYRWTSTSGSCPCAAGSAFYLNAIATHEFGHVIGLCHVNQPSALMYPSFGVCENKSKGADENAGQNALCY